MGFFNALHAGGGLRAAARSLAESLVSGPTFAHGMTSSFSQNGQ